MTVRTRAPGAGAVAVDHSVLADATAVRLLVLRATRSGGVVRDHPEQTVVHLPPASAAAYAEHVTALLVRRFGDAAVGVATGRRSGPRLVDEARRAALYGRLRPEQRPWRIGDHDVEEGLLAVDGVIEVSAVALDPVAGRPELIATLSAYLRHDRDRPRAARRLDVHVRTLDYRLRTIERETGHSPRSVRGGAALRLALLARGLLELGLQPPRGARPLPVGPVPIGAARHARLPQVSVIGTEAPAPS